ncbi:MAG: HAMP domain-containing sensor histidine kinase [Dermatophilus congolensis]|nr:HAMP domain-containing sensor histidine kinase [Dermatophilus congolensis]
MTATRAAEHGSRVSARWRIVGWIVLTTALSLLAVMVTLRSVLLTQVATQANYGIVQEVDEFETFSSEGVDPTTAAPFTSVTALMERYLSRQTPATGEALIGITPTEVFFSDNAAKDAGEALAGDRARLQAILDHPDESGVTATPHGELRWGRISTEIAGENATLIVGAFTEVEKEQVDRDTLLLMGVAIAGLLLTAGMAWFAAGQILRPVRNIREVADRIDASDLSQRVPVEGRDDIAQLAVTFNEMLERLERARSTSQHFVREAQHRLVPPRDRLAQNLRLLADPGLDATGRDAALRDSNRALELMRSTLSDLDLLSRLDNPESLEPRPVELRELTRRIVGIAAATSPDRHWSLEHAPSATVTIDSDRTVEAMSQLLRNAYDHTGPGERIRIGAGLVEGGAEKVARFWVGNDGPVIDQERARALFEQYRSAGEGVAGVVDDGADGMGLGLAVVRAVADAHGGSAWVESSEQEGTRFGLDLPSRPTRSDAAERHVDALTSALGHEL